MKKIGAGFVLLIIILLGTPILNGILMERVVNKVVEDMNSLYADTGTDYSIEILQYNRGLFSSDIDWKINFGELKAVYGISEVILSERARHGFTGVVSTTSLDKNEWFTTFVSENLQGSNPLTISTRYSLLGNITTTCSTDAFSFTAENQNISVLPGNFEIATDSALKEFTSSGNWQGINIADRLITGAMSVSSDLEMISSFLWDGEASFTLQKMVLKEEQASFDLAGLSGKYTLDVDQPKNRFSSTSEISVKSIVAGDSTIANTAAQFSVKNVDTVGYEMFMKTYLQLVSEILSTIAEAENDPELAKAIFEQQLATAGFQLIGAFEKLLKKDFELKINDAHMTLNNSELKGDITVRLLKDMTLMEFAPIVGQPELLLDILYIKSAASLPASLMGDNPMLLEPAYPGMQTGLFIKDGGILSHSAETREGKLYLNSEEVVLAR